MINKFLIKHNYNIINLQSDESVRAEAISAQHLRSNVSTFGAEHPARTLAHDLPDEKEKVEEADYGGHEEGDGQMGSRL